MDLRLRSNFPHLMHAQPLESGEKPPGQDPAQLEGWRGRSGRGADEPERKHEGIPDVTLEQEIY
jgi:hypothetical protein